MADYNQQVQFGHQPRQLSIMTVLSASVAAIAIGGPMLAMMGFSFLVSTTLLVVCSPLFLLFSPLLVGVGLVFVGTLVGFALATVMALTGLSIFGWLTREIRVRIGGLSKLREQPHIMKRKRGDYWTDNFATNTA
ncbi:oleosin S1-2 [Abrus precatorius]|uniref:Oleosin S1-2 n=1 Tax=Abrus precatorius TaxID=3816 RepID=A0A8B8ML34_ABRPR|nr:oleosin S1-2 [Abrus precatorius]